MLSKSERQAFHKALANDGAAKVERVECGIYLVPSATDAGTVYTVTGFRTDGADFRCTCPAGERGIPCWHKCAVRLRKVQEAARAQARKLHRATAPAAAPSPALVLFADGPIDAVAQLAPAA
jgi:hypothetical protein